MTICKIIIEVDTVETMYDYNLEKINYTICEITSSICRDIEDYEGYLEVKEDTLNNIDNRISKIFN